MGKKIILLSMVLIIGTTLNAHAQKDWTRSDILKITDANAKQNGYDIDKMSVSFNIHNSLWRKTSTRKINSTITKKLLKYEKYLAVYYAPLQQNVLSSDLWIFLDLDSGEIITSLKGQ